MARRRLSAEEIRLQKDLSELESYDKAIISFPDEKDILHFIVRIKPEVGLWKDHNFDFKFDIPKDWPIERPHITCLTKIWHPNIDEEGNVCLDILKSKYNPTLTIEQLIGGLYFVLQYPNPHSPLNEAAANQMLRSLDEFKETIEEYLEEFCPED